MTGWAVVKTEVPKGNSTSALLLINEECLEALEKLGNRLRFGVRFTKLKIFRPSIIDGYTDEDDDANKWLDVMNIGEED